MFLLLGVIPVVELLLDLFGGECVVRVCHFTKIALYLSLVKSPFIIDEKLRPLVLGLKGKMTKSLIKLAKH